MWRILLIHTFALSFPNWKVDTNSPVLKTMGIFHRIPLLEKKEEEGIVFCANFLLSVVPGEWTSFFRCCIVIPKAFGLTGKYLWIILVLWLCCSCSRWVFIISIVKLKWFCKEFVLRGSALCTLFKKKEKKNIVTPSIVIWFWGRCFWTRWVSFFIILKDFYA